MVRIADTLKQQNDLDTFPVAYADGIWIDKNKGIDPDYKSLQYMYDNNLLGDGSSIQVDTLPVANQSEVGNIYQYVGNNGTYKKGHFYECVLMHNYNGASTSIYVWQDVGHLRFNHVVYNCTVPPVNTDYTPSDIIYYGGKTMGNFKSGHYYRAIPIATPQKHYGVALWETPSSGYQYLCYTPFEFRIGFIVYPTGTGGESTPYQITDFDDEGITISPYGWSGATKHFVGASYATTVEGWEELESGNPVIEDVNVLPTGSDIENRIYRTKSVSSQTTEVLLVIPADVTQNERLMACTNTLSTWTVSGATLYPPKDEYWKWNDKEMYSITCDSTRTVFTTKTQSGGTQDDTYSIEVAWSSNFYVSPYEKAVYAGDKDMETNDRLALYSDVGGNIFYGTMDEWNALSTAEKTKYQFMSDEQVGGGEILPYAVDATLKPKIQFYGVVASTGTGSFRRLKLSDNISILICPNVGTVTGASSSGEARCTFFFPKTSGKKYDLISFSARQSITATAYLGYSEFKEMSDDWRVDFYMYDCSANNGIYCTATVLEYTA